jgi:peptide/nickel transport system permease protein
VLGGVQMTAVIRIIRGQVLSLRPSAYIEAARASGAATPRILLQHVLPNVVPTSIVLATIYLGAVILAEASLSFLGFGVRPPYPSWGSMLNTSARTQMLRAPALSVWPGLAITLVVFSFNMFGDALRDALDPRLRGTGPGR